MSMSLMRVRLIESIASAEELMGGLTLKMDVVSDIVTNLRSFHELTHTKRDENG